MSRLSKDPFHSIMAGILPDTVQRRDLLRAGLLFGGAAAAGPLIAACGSSGGSAGAPASTGSTATGSTAAGSSLAGKKVGVMVPETIEVITQELQYNQEQAARPGNGEHIDIVNADGDSLREYDIANQFIAEDYDAVILFPLQATGWGPTVAAANAKKIPMFNHGSAPISGITQNIVVSHYTAGLEVAKTAAAWLNKYHNGEGQVGLLVIINAPAIALRGKGFVAGIKQYAPKAQIVDQVFAQTESDGVSAAGNMLSAYPDLKMILSAGDDPGLGAYSVITERGVTNPTDFFIGSCDGETQALTYIQQNTIYQCDWSFYFDLSGILMEEDAESAMRGKAVPPVRIQGGSVLTRATIPQYNSLNYFASAEQATLSKYYTYCNEQFTTNQTSLGSCDISNLQ
jgi:ABC-type sugar transport system substrate-binding protein